MAFIMGLQQEQRREHIITDNIAGTIPILPATNLASSEGALPLGDAPSFGYAPFWRPRRRSCRMATFTVGLSGLANTIYRTRRGRVPAIAVVPGSELTILSDAGQRRS
jgi:hypothetical protein